MDRKEELAKALKMSAENSSKAFKFVSLIVDESSFVEYDAFVCSETLLGKAYGEGVLAGTASVDDVQVCVFSQNSSVLKGGMGTLAAKKILKCMDKAEQTHSPLISILDSSGARIDEGLEVLESYGLLLKKAAKISGSVPHIAIVKGACFGMMSYFTAFADVVIQVDKAQLCSSSPYVLSAKSGTDAAKIGAAAFHKKTGAISLSAKTDEEAAQLVKDVLSYVTCPDFSECGCEDECCDCGGDCDCEGGDCGCEDDLNRTLTVTDCKNIKALLNDIADAESVLELKADYGAEVVTALGRIGGRAVGFVANNGAVNGGRITCEGTKKITNFLYLLGCWNLPVINLVNTSGASADMGEENKEIIAGMSDLIGWYASFEGLKLALICGEVSGAGYTVFASKALGYDYTIAWATASISVLENAAAANLMYGAEIAAANQGNREKAVAKIAKDYSENNSALKAAESGKIDAVIAPEHSRIYLAAALESSL